MWRFSWLPKRVQRARGIPMSRIVWLWYRENQEPGMASSDYLEADERMAELIADNKRLRLAIKRIYNAVDSFMEGAGDPEFSNYSWIIGVSADALKK